MGMSGYKTNMVDIDDLKSQVSSLLLSICRNLDSQDIKGAENEALKIVELLRAKLDENDAKYCTVITNCPGNKIARIKTVRQLYTLGLKEAKDIVDSKGDKEVTVKNFISHREAREIKTLFGDSVRIVCNFSPEHECDFEKGEF